MCAHPAAAVVPEHESAKPLRIRLKPSRKHLHCHVAGRPNCVSSARYTSPIPPDPSFLRMRKCASVLPIMTNAGSGGDFRDRQAKFGDDVLSVEGILI